MQRENAMSLVDDRKKALMLASVASMIERFNVSNIQLLQSMGFKVDVAANFTNPGTITIDRAENFKKYLANIDVDVFDVPIPRSLNFRAIILSYIQIKTLIDNKKYDLIHCHSPIGAVICRMAAKKVRKNGAKVIYTAHGFHFYRGAPLQNWLLFYPIEKWMSHYTDVLITINTEDYKRAKEHFYVRKIEYIPGVGIDIQKFKKRNDSRKRIRAEIGIADQRRVLLSVGELNRNKNHETVIKAIAGIDMVYVIVGKGPLKERLKTIAEECGVELHLMGFRSDVADFYSSADIYVLPSIREGLNVSLMEAMASGLPCVASNIRGNVDLIENKQLLVDSFDVSGFANVLSILSRLNKEILIEEGKRNMEVIRNYDKSIILNKMRKIYEDDDAIISRRSREK